MAPLPSLQGFFATHPSIPHHLPSSPSFTSLSSTWVAVPYQPLAIARPQSAADVAALVSHCAATATPFVIRVGGHDTQGRTAVDGALAIDLRDVAYVHVAPDRATARVGGGILHGALLAALAPHGLVAATGTVGTVGWVGWATLGGYGPLAPSHGMGADQIVGAKLVDAKGSVVEADERLLKGLRGGGGCLGAIVEVTIKVHPMTEFQGGMIIYESSNLRDAVSSYFNNLSALLASTPLPENIYFQPMILTVPGLGKVLSTGFSWSGALDGAALAWQQKISALAPLAMCTVKATTIADYVAEVTPMVPARVFQGRCRTVSLRGLRTTPAAVEAIARFAERQPATTAATSIHYLHGLPTRAGAAASVFGNRREHLMVEIIGLTADAADAPAAGAWADEFAEELGAADGAMGATYLPLTPREEVDLQRVYGQENLDGLKRLKREFDPDNVFRLSLPQLEV